MIYIQERSGSISCFTMQWLGNRTVSTAALMRKQDINSGDRPETKKKRRPHKNSKLGCSNCKSRQIKCDETLPICHNCQRRGDSCSYLFLTYEEYQYLIGLKSSTGNEDPTKPSQHEPQAQTNPCPNQESATIKTERPIVPITSTKLSRQNPKFNGSFDHEDGLSIGEDGSNLFSEITPQLISKIYNIEYRADDFTYRPIEPGVKPACRKGSNPCPKAHKPENTLSYYEEYIPSDIPKIPLEENCLESCVPSAEAEFVDFDTDYFATVASESLTPEETATVKGVQNANDVGSTNVDKYGAPFETPSPSDDSSLLEDPNIGTGHLEGARQVNKTLTLYRESEFKWFGPFLNTLMITFYHYARQTLPELFKTIGCFDIDAFFEKVYRVQLNVMLLFSPITQKSMLLFVFDVVKNILFKQKAILPILNEEMRINVSNVCEDISSKKLSDLTSLLQNQYLCNYNQHTKRQREILLSGFITLAACTSYHYNLGYKQSLNAELREKCIKYVDTFSTGMFSITLNENAKAKAEQIDLIGNYSKHILNHTKFTIVQNYNSEILLEIFTNLKQLKLDRIENFKTKRWSSNYINLLHFLEKHIHFFKVFREDNCLLGFDNGYVIKMINEWYQIFPYDLVNIMYTVSSNEDIEISKLIYLTFQALRYYLEAIVPGVRSLVRNSLVGSEKLGYDETSKMMNIYRSLAKKNNKIYAIYCIRVMTFFIIRLDKIRATSKYMYIPEISGTRDISPGERCNSLLKNWKLRDAITEIQKVSLDLNIGTYIESYNYPKLNMGENIKIKSNNLVKFRTKSKLILDFEKTNTGLLSNDYDARADVLNMTELAMVLLEVEGEIKNDKINFRHAISSTADSDINENTLRNCWEIENFIRHGQ